MQRQAAAEQAAKLQAELDAIRAAATKAAPRTYVVQGGDSLSVIAKKVYGNAARWPDIFNANRDKIKDADRIFPGQELVIPD